MLRYEASAEQIDAW